MRRVKRKKKTKRIIEKGGITRRRRDKRTVKGRAGEEEQPRTRSDEWKEGTKDEWEEDCGKMNVNAKLRIGLTELPRVTDEEEEEKRKSEEMRSLR